MSYDHAFTLAFSASSFQPDASDITEAEFLDAIYYRLKSLTPAEIFEAVLPPYDTHFEGWFISNGSDDLDQIQKCQDTNIFETDQAAWAFVLTQALAGSMFHKRALQQIKTNNPTDYDLMMVSVHGETT